jgi:hypothetical protein
MNLKEIERAVAGIQSSLFKKSGSPTGGMLKSHLRGSGLQFKEHQVYNHGDDVRFIDWKLSARSTNTYIKTFEEDRNVEIVVVVDFIPTMSYGSNGIAKIHMAFEIVALLYLLAQESQDQVKVILFTEELKILPPKRGRPGLIMFINELEKMGWISKDGKFLNQIIKPSKMSEKDKILIIKGELSKRKEILYLSDYFKITEEKGFLKLKNELRFHGIQLLSPIDEKPLDFAIPTFKKATIGRVAPPFMTLWPRAIKLNTTERYLDQFVRKFR